MAIIHVHGQLGKLSFGETNQRMRVYEPGNVSLALPSLPSCLGNDGIKIISETEENSEEFVSARRLINCAERIIFLGLAYDPTNLYRLGMCHPPSVNIDRNNSNTEITGSSYGLNPPRLTSRLSQKRQTTPRFGKTTSGGSFN